jgi:hypothetical protein
MFQFFKKYLWFVLVTLILFFIIRLPNLFEPLWYGDENYYAVIGKVLSNGGLLYTDIWDNKPPLLYLVYTVNYFFFSNTLWILKLLNIALNLCSIWLLLKLFNLWFVKANSIICYSIALFLFTLGWEISFFNAENLFVPLVLTGVLYFTKNMQEKDFSYKLTSIGSIFFSLALFTKLVVFPEVFVIVLSFFTIYLVQKKPHISLALKQFSFITAILLLPYLLLVLYYVGVGNLAQLYNGLLGTGDSYVSAFTSPVVIFGFEVGVKGIYLRSILLVVAVATLVVFYVKRWITTVAFFFSSWIIACIYCTLISERNYPHYIIQLYPPAILIASYILSGVVSRQFELKKSILYIVSFSLILQFYIIVFTKFSPIPYYTKPIDKAAEFYFLKLSAKSLDNWQRSFNMNSYDTQQDLKNFVKTTSIKHTDKVLVIGNIAELYLALDVLPAYKYPVYYQFKDSPSQVIQQAKSSQSKLYILEKNISEYSEYAKLLKSEFTLALETKELEVYLP